MLLVSLIRHPVTRMDLLNFLLDAQESKQTFVVILPRGAGMNQVNNLRSLLSKQRASMIKRGIPYTDFGVRSHVMPWTELDGIQHEAVLFRTYRTIRHAVVTEIQKPRRIHHG